MHCDAATFRVSYFLCKLLLQSLYFLRALTFSKRLYSFTQKLLFQRLQFFRTANFQQVTLRSFQALKYPGVNRVVHFSKTASIKYHDQNFCITIAFSGHHSTEQFIEECKKFSFWRNLIKISLSILNFSTESAEKPII